MPEVMHIKQSQHNGIWLNPIYILPDSNISFGFNRFQLSIVAPLKSIISFLVFNWKVWLTIIDM
jgi:hypothetical protein